MRRLNTIARTIRPGRGVNRDGNRNRARALFAAKTLQAELHLAGDYQCIGGLAQPRDINLIVNLIGCGEKNPAPGGDRIFNQRQHPGMRAGCWTAMVRRVGGLGARAPEAKNHLDRRLCAVRRRGLRGGLGSRAGSVLIHCQCYFCIRRNAHGRAPGFAD
jgi:hypothetical protein